MCKVYTGYCGTSEIEHGLCACTVDNPLAKARGLSLRTGAQTMLYLSLILYKLIISLLFAKLIPWHLWRIQRWNRHSFVVFFVSVIKALQKTQRRRSFGVETSYSRTSTARTPFWRWKLVRDRGSSSQRGLIKAPGQEAKKGYLFDILEREDTCMLCVNIRIASSQYAIFKIKKKITLNYPKSATMGFCF